MVKKSELTKEYYKIGELAKMIGKQTRTVQSYCIRGCITDKGFSYYMSYDGAMLTNDITSDGYYVDYDGVWISKR